MGANGSLARTGGKTPLGSEYKHVEYIHGVEIVQLKNPNQSVRLPYHSNKPNSYAAIYNRNGKGLYGIAHYGKDGNKDWEIHNNNHYGMKPHYHPWTKEGPRSIPRSDKPGETMSETYRLDNRRQELFDKINNHGD